MLRFVLLRLLYLPLSLLLLSLVCFALTQATPGDPVAALMSSRSVRFSGTDPGTYEQLYAQVARRRGVDRPAFYFAVTTAALPDTLHRIVQRDQRRALRRMAYHYGNWPAVQHWYRQLRTVAYDTSRTDGPEVAVARRLLTVDDPVTIRRQLATLTAGGKLPLAFDRLTAAATPRRALLPRLDWYGTDNQYHHYVAGLLRGDLGISTQDRQPVADKIGDALPWTLLLNGIAILVVYLLAIPAGLYMGGYRGSRFDRYSTLLLFILFGIPSFWIATLITNFFTTPAFGMDWFPSMGFGEFPPDAGFLTVLRIRAAHLFLPVLCLAYPAWAYVSRHLREAVIAELDQPYVKVAALKGLSRSQILWGHVLRNASFPLITLLGSLLPSLLAGSILIERIFNLPGMGQLLFSGATARDWPLVISLVLINGLLTTVGLLLADLAYALVDPRVQLPQSTAP